MSETSDRVESYAKAFLEVARTEGHLAEVEDELFRFARAYNASDELRLALTDPNLPLARKVAVIQDLLERKALATSQALVLAVVVSGRAGELEQIVDKFVELAVAERAHEVAEVRSAVPLSDEDVERLRVALSKCHPQERRGEGRRRPRGHGRHRHQDGRPHHRRVRASPPRPAARTDLAREHCGQRRLGRNQMAELTINVEEIAAALKAHVSTFSPTLDSANVGQVLEVGDGIARVAGLPETSVNEVLEFEGGTLGLALNLDEASIGAVVLGEASHVEEGGAVKATGRILSVPVGDALIGRVVDSLGRAIDGKGPIASTEVRRLEVQAPGIVGRQPVHEPLQTGIKAIDAMTPVGRGQRELIIGDRKTGKTTVAIDTILAQKGQGVKCIYVAIGQKGSTVAQTVATLEEHGAMDYTVVVQRARRRRSRVQVPRPLRRVRHRPALDGQRRARARRVRRPVEAGRVVPPDVAAAAPPAGP